MVADYQLTKNTSWVSFNIYIKQSDISCATLVRYEYILLQCYLHFQRGGPLLVVGYVLDRSDPYSSQALTFTLTEVKTLIIYSV